MLAKIGSFFAGVLTPTAPLSFGRFMALVMTSHVLLWDIASLVFAWRFNLYHLAPGQQALPLLPDVVTLAGQAAFCATFYGITKYGDIKNGNGNGTGTPGAP